MANYEAIGRKLSLRFPEETDREIIKKMTADAVFSDNATIHIVASNKNAQIVAVAVVEENILTAYTAKDEKIVFTEPKGVMPDVCCLLTVLS